MPVGALLAIGYFALASWLAWLVAEQGAGGWVGVFACVALIGAAKFAVFAPVSLILLARAKLAERRATASA